MNLTFEQQTILIGILVVIYFIIVIPVVKRFIRRNKIERQEPGPGSELISKPEPEHEPESESDPKLMQDVVVESETDSESEQKPDFQVKPELEIESNPEGGSELDLESGQEPEDDSEHGSDYELGSESETETNPEIEQVTEPEAELEPEPVVKFLYVDYDIPIDNNQLSNENFPLVRFPEKGTIVRNHKTGNRFLRGYKEKYFEKSLKRYFNSEFEILGNIRINTGDSTRPYEPDIALIDSKSGLNIRVDIEVDEPYAGITRIATHIKGEDEIRDSYFNGRGWIVIRFAEIQVHKQELNCIAFISRVIKSIYPDYVIPASLKEIPNPDKIEHWDIIQSQKWEEEKYREEYLDHSFGYIDIEDDIEDSKLNEQELAEEGQVNDSIDYNYESNEFQPISEQIRYIDSKIRFDEENHKYYINGVKALSIYDLVEKFFHAFDRERKAREYAEVHNLIYQDVVQSWVEKGIESRNKGKKLHKNIDRLIKDGELSDGVEFEQFLDFWNDNNFEEKISRWHIYDQKYMLAGTIDFVASYNGRIEIYDWIRSKNIIENGYPIEESFRGVTTGIGPLNDIQDTTYWKYSLRINFYKYLLEKNYGLEVDNMHLIVIHEKYDQYYDLVIEDMQDKVVKIIEAINQKIEN